MTSDNRTFSESWHRVSDLRVSLRPGLSIRKQLFRGQTWYILQDPFSNHFYRLGPESLQFVKRLNKDRSVAQVWEECLEHDPESAPGQEDVIQLLAQFYHANLLFCELPVDSRKLFARYRDRRQREMRSKILNLMFMRIPLFDPTWLLERCRLLEKTLTGRFAAVVWFLVLGLAMKTVVEQSHLIAGETKNLLNFDNLILLYLGLLICKSLHELGHTLICRKFGGEVHTIGVMLIVLAPLPYMDATASWAFQKRRQRILVAASGMLFEFFAAACAALLWANTGPGSLHSLAFNMMVVASVSTLIFNLNPLLRYDGYYILSDLLDIPNLHERALEQLKFVVHRWFFGDLQATSPASSKAEAFWLISYAVLSGLYRIFVYGAIILFVADRFLLLGILMAVFCLLTWGLLPIGRFFHYLFTSSQLARQRSRAVGVSLLSLMTAALLLGLVPFPHHFRAPGVVEAESLVPVLSQSEGQLLEILVSDGVQIKKGEPLARLRNPELDIEMALIAAQRDEVLAQMQQNVTLAGAEARRILEKQLATLDQRLQRSRQQKKQLLVLAPAEGIWVARESRELKEAWLARGTELGQILSPVRFSFSAVVSQEEAASLFNGKMNLQAEVRLTGQGGKVIEVSEYRIIPFQQEILPSAALGWKSGGDVAVSGDDQQGLKTLEPFFRIDATLKISC